MLKCLGTSPWWGKGLRQVSFRALDCEIEGQAICEALKEVAVACIGEDSKSLEANKVLTSPVRREPGQVKPRRGNMGTALQIYGRP